MLLAYVIRFMGAQKPELCILPEKPDQFSFVVPVDFLFETEAAVFRIGPSEALRVWIDQHDGGKIIEPVQPSKIYLTPSQADRPGIAVKAVKVVKVDIDHFHSFFRQDRGPGKEEEWKRFVPNEVQM